MNRSKLQLMLLCLLFAAPPVAAYIYFIVYSGSLSAISPTTANYGELVQPARPIESVVLNTIDGADFSFSDLYSKWTLLYIGDTHCDQACSDQLYNIHQVRLTQGKNLGRVTSVYVLPANASSTLVEEIRKSLPSMMVLLASSEAYFKLVKQFEINGIPGDSSERAYVIDPLGNLMMSYPNGTNPSNMRKDLKKLLKVSQIG